jgi:hypothetical protein
VSAEKGKSTEKRERKKALRDRTKGYLYIRHSQKTRVMEFRGNENRKKSGLGEADGRKSNLIIFEITDQFLIISVSFRCRQL